MTYKLSIGSLNCGQGQNEWITMIKGNSEELAKLNKLSANQDKEFLTEYYKEVEARVAEKLKNLNIICLQELVTEDRPLIETLKKYNFKIYYPSPTDNTIKCAIAVHQDSFDEIEEIHILSKSGPKQGIYGQDIAGVNVKIKNTSWKLAFASLHSWGFQLYPKKYAHKTYDEHDKNQMRYAKEYAEEAISMMEQVKADYCFIAGDMNNNLKNKTKPFQIIEDAGYEILEPDQPTNVNAGDECFNYKYRIIDYIFARLSTSIWKRIASIFSRQIMITVERARVMEGFDFTMDGHCSDHKPIFTEMTLTEQPAKIVQLWRYLFRCR